MHAAVPVVGVLGLGGVAATATVSVLAVNGHFQQKSNVWDALTLASTNNNNFSGKFGEDSKYHLIDTDSSSNNWYWDKIYKESLSQRRADRGRSDDFKSISSSQDLRNKCKEWYSKRTTDVLSGNTGDKVSVWKYCSRIAQPPELLVEANTARGETADANSIGFMYGSILVNTNIVRSNRRFWQSQEDAFLNQGAPLAGPFKDLYDRGKDGQKPTKSSVTPLGEVCQEMYKKAVSSADKDLKQMIFKYCSINPTRRVNS